MEGKASIARSDLEQMLVEETAEPKAMPLSLLEHITCEFSDDQEIGRGGFAVVYKGILGDKAVAVKRLSKAYMHETEVHREVQCLMRVKHKNVVRFLGYCADTQGSMERYNGELIMADVRQRLLCFEYIPKGSLDKFIKELREGGIIARSADLYSIGVIIIEILTGQKGYQPTEDVLESWSDRLERSQRDTLCEQIQVCYELALECGDFNPKKRPASARDITERLHEMENIQLNGQTRYTRPQGSANPAWNEEFMFIASEPSEDPLVVTVEERLSRGRGEPIGHVIIPVASPYVPRNDLSKSVPSRWFSLSQGTKVVDDRGESAKTLASKIHLRLTLETAYHVLDESMDYSSDLQPAEP